MGLMSLEEVRWSNFEAMRPCDLGIVPLPGRNPLVAGLCWVDAMLLLAEVMVIAYHGEGAQSWMAWGQR